MLFNCLTAAFLEAFSSDQLKVRFRIMRRYSVEKDNERGLNVGLGMILTLDWIDLSFYRNMGVEKCNDFYKTK